MNTKSLVWTGEQDSIFSFFAGGAGDAVIEATAGSSKTTTIIEGINRLPASDRTCYLVFNKKNQLEAQDKIKNPLVNVSTLHAFGYSFLRDHWRGVRGDAWVEMNRAKQLCPPDAPKQFVFQVVTLVKFLKNSFITPTEKDAKDTVNLRNIELSSKIEAEGWTVTRMCEIALKSIELSLTYPRDKKISFEDMCFLPVRLGMVKPTFDTIVCDESQDIALPQMEMVKAARNPGGRIILVGDPQQSCYFFRGASASHMQKFKEDFTAKEFSLSMSFRCPRAVVALAQTVFPGIVAWDGSGEGKVETINLDKCFAQVLPGDIILSRSNAPLVKNCLALIRQNKAAYVLGKDIARGLIALVNDLSANTVNGFLDNLEKWQGAQSAKASGMFAAKRIETVNDTAETLRAIAESAIEFADIEKKLNSLFQDSENVRVPSVILSTVHKFKGLEAKRVNILTETFKSGRRKMSAEEIKEEKNLYFIAITRSQDTLSLVGQ